MKYKITITVIVCALIIAGSVVEYVYVNRAFDELETRLDKVMEYEEYPLEEVEELTEWWDQTSEWLEISVPVIQLNEITVTLSELCGAVEAEDYDTASALLTRIKAYSENISDIYKMRFKKDNIYVEIYFLPYIIVNIKIHFSNTEINFVLR